MKWGSSGERSESNLVFEEWLAFLVIDWPELKMIVLFVAPFNAWISCMEWRLYLLSSFDELLEVLISFFFNGYY